MLKSRRNFDTFRTVKERAGCRRAIIKLAIQPMIYKGTWDGMMAMSPAPENPDGWQRSHMSDGLRKQMEKMASEGFWGKIKLERGYRDYPDRLMNGAKPGWKA